MDRETMFAPGRGPRWCLRVPGAAEAVSESGARSGAEAPAHAIGHRPSPGEGAAGFHFGGRAPAHEDGGSVRHHFIGAAADDHDAAHPKIGGLLPLTIGEQGRAANGRT